MGPRTPSPSFTLQLSSDEHLRDFEIVMANEFFSRIIYFDIIRCHDEMVALDQAKVLLTTTADRNKERQQRKNASLVVGVLMLIASVHSHCKVITTVVIRPLDDHSQSMFSRMSISNCSTVI